LRDRGSSRKKTVPRINILSVRETTRVAAVELINLTGFAADRLLTMDAEGREVLLVVAKATFRIAPPAILELADRPEPIQPVDAYRGDPGVASLEAAGEASPFKPGTDVLLSGCAYPNPRDPELTLAGFRMGSMKKMIRVLGDRRWERALSGYRASAPGRFEKIPLIYERAFGGVDASDARAVETCAENPVGVGFRARHSRAAVAGQLLPNLEDPLDPITEPGQRVRPHALGPIPPHWSPRAALAGTYDAAWRKQRMPLAPRDLDPRYHQAAPPDQIRAGHLKGGELIEVIGMAPEGALRCEIPEVRPEVVIRVLGEREAPPTVCDTLAIDMERRTLCLVWRASMVVQGRVDGIHWIKVQPGN